MLHAPTIHRFCAAQSDSDVRDAFASLLSELQWEQNDQIPWRDDAAAVRNAMQEIADRGTAPIWRTHKAVDPFSGVGDDWAHGSFVAFPPNDGAHGLGYGGGLFPPGYSFVTRFSDRIGADRPVAGDFGLEWIAHDHGNPRLRQKAIGEASSVAALRQKLGDPATSVHEAVGLVYETPVSKETATVEERLIVKSGTDGRFEIFRVPESSEWSQILSRMEQLDKAQASQPRNFGNMPPAAAAGKKCLPVATILAKMEAAGKGTPLTATYGQRPDLLADARHADEKLALDVKVDSLLDLADGSAQMVEVAAVSVGTHEIMGVWENVIDQISKGNAATMLDLQAEWKFPYPPEIAGHIVEALQDKVIGVSVVDSMRGLRAAVKSHIAAAHPPAAPEVSVVPAEAGPAAIADASKTAISAAGAQSIGRLRSRLGAVYSDLMRTPELVTEGDLDFQRSEPERPR